MRVTIKDVAKKAGVSPTSVSLVLNNRPNNISKETKKIIFNAAKELNYTPNFFAQSLKSSMSDMIAIILPSLSNPFFAELASNLNTLAAEKNLTALIIETRYKEEPIDQIIDTLKKFRVIGIVLIVSSYHQDIINFIQEGDIPLVTTDIKLDNAPSIFVDNIHGGVIATQHLINHGHQKIGCYTGPKGIHSSDNRVKGYTKALKRNGINEMFFFEGNYNLGKEDKALDYFLCSNCSAVFALNDMMAYGLYKAARKRRLSIPNDLSIVGFDNISFSEVVFPELTTVDQPISQMSEKIISILIKNIQRQPVEDTTIIKPSLIKRNSVCHFKK